MTRAVTRAAALDPVLVLVAHGTARAGARSVVGALVAAVGRELPGVDVRLAHVDVQSPTLARVMAGVRAEKRAAVVVPLLLTTGYHVDVDIADAVDPALDAVTPALGGADVLVDLGIERLAAAGATGLDAVVVAGAGSSREAARAEVVAYAAAVGARLGVPASVGWAAAGEPTVATAVTDAREAGAQRVGVVTYLLAPGVFAERTVEQASERGAVAVGATLGLADPGPDDRLTMLVVARYEAGRTPP